MKVLHGTTIEVGDNDTIDGIRVVNSNPDQPALVCDADADGWRLGQFIAEGGRGIILRGAHGVAKGVKAFGTSRGIQVYETDRVQERISNDLTLDDCFVDRTVDDDASGIHVMGPVFGLTIRDCLIRDAAQDGITAYDHGNDILRVVRCDVVGYGNHGMHLGGHQVYVTGGGAKGGTLDRGTTLFIGNHVGRPDVDYAYVGGGFFANSPVNRAALWARGVKRMDCGFWRARMARRLEVLDDVASHRHLEGAT